MWALYVIVMMANLEVYQTLFGISDPRWSCSTVKFRGSAALELFLQSWSSPKHALNQLCLLHLDGVGFDLVSSPFADGTLYQIPA
jgi:hypothetical protein